MKSLYFYSQGYLYVKIGLFLISLGACLALYILLKSPKTAAPSRLAAVPRRPEDLPTAHLDYSPTAFTVDVELYEHGQRPKKDAFKKSVYEENTHSFDQSSVARDASTEFLQEHPAGPGADSFIDKEKDATAFLDD